MKKCPHCAEEIQDDAKVCGQCHSDLTVAPPPGQPIQRETSTKAIASLILIILFVIIFVSLTFPMVLRGVRKTFDDTILYGTLYGLISLSLSATIFAIIYGHKARRDIRRSAGRLKGAWIARAGKAPGYLFTIVMFFIVLIMYGASKSSSGCNPPSPIGSLRTLNTSLVTYTSTYEGGYAPSLAALGGADDKTLPSAQTAGLIDDVLASGKKIDYLFTYVPWNSDDKGFRACYVIRADPSDDLFDAQKQRQKQKIYFMDATPLLFSLLAPTNYQAIAQAQNHYFTDQTGAIRAEQGKPAGKHSPFACADCGPSPPEWLPAAARSCPTEEEPEPLPAAGTAQSEPGIASLGRPCMP